MLRQAFLPARTIRSCTFRWRPVRQWHRRPLLTLAIESSCDDTAVAVLETSHRADENASRHLSDNDHARNRKLLESPDCIKHEQRSAQTGSGASSRPAAVLHFNEKITADSAHFRGIHPLVALESHQRNLASLVQKALASLRDDDGRPRIPDFISVTRGPGMRSNLATGLDMAKGLAVAWRVPVIGVHHMQAHALTPRLVSAMTRSGESHEQEPLFPYLSLLVSGGHTLLVYTSSLTEHNILASSDMPVGSALDQAARLILPAEVLQTSASTMYGAALERFAFPQATSNHYQSYEPPNKPTAAYQKKIRSSSDPWPWSYTPPLAKKRESMEFSFTGIVSTTQRVITYTQLPNKETRELRAEAPPIEERQALAKEAMRVSFEHIAQRVTMALDQLGEPVSTLVVSGGVASNQYLRAILSAWLNSFGYSNVQINCPPPALCTDNAAMIAWAGYEMFQAGWRSDLGITARRKWPLGPSMNATDPEVAHGQGEEPAVGVLGIDGWYNVDHIGLESRPVGRVLGEEARPWTK